MTGPLLSFPFPFRFQCDRLLNTISTEFATLRGIIRVWQKSSSRDISRNRSQGTSKALHSSPSEREGNNMPAVSFIDAIPNHVSLEEHRTLTGATPTSFSDIPPILRQKVDNVRIAFDPPLDNFSPDDGALGTLYIIERLGSSSSSPFLSPRSNTDVASNSVLVYHSSTGRTLQVEYPSIALHATSRGDSSPYVYCHLDEPPAADAPAPDADDTLVMRVLLLTPQDPASREFRSNTYVLFPA
jgi:hypothetical protein